MKGKIKANKKYFKIRVHRIINFLYTVNFTYYIIALIRIIRISELK